MARDAHTLVSYLMFQYEWRLQNQAESRKPVQEITCLMLLVIVFYDMRLCSLRAPKHCKSTKEGFCTQPNTQVPLTTDSKQFANYTCHNQYLHCVHGHNTRPMGNVIRTAHSGFLAQHLETNQTKKPQHPVPPWKCCPLSCKNQMTDHVLPI